MRWAPKFIRNGMAKKDIETLSSILGGEQAAPFIPLSPSALTSASSLRLTESQLMEVARHRIRKHDYERRQEIKQIHARMARLMTDEFHEQVSDWTQEQSHEDIKPPWEDD